MIRNTSQHARHQFIDARTASKGIRNQSKYYKGAVFVRDGHPEKTIVIEYASPKSFEVKLYGYKNLASKNMIARTGGRPIKTQAELDELKQQLNVLGIIIPGMEHSRVGCG